MKMRQKNQEILKEMPHLALGTTANKYTSKQV